jgi:outer membrane protease
MINKIILTLILLSSTLTSKSQRVNSIDTFINYFLNNKLSIEIKFNDETNNKAKYLLVIKSNELSEMVTKEGKVVFSPSISYFIFNNKDTGGMYNQKIEMSNFSKRCVH